MACELLESIDALIQKAEATRSLHVLKAERNASLLLQHSELLQGLKTLRAYIDGQATITCALSERVNVLASLYFEPEPKRWLIRPTMATRFRSALWALLDLARDMKGSAEE